MKIEQLLVQHFYNHRSITLQGMGTFTLSPDIILPSENDKEPELPDNSIIFEYNTKAPEDEKLISYIVQQTRKIRPLASADLDSYLVLGKQFLNIGKPFNIEGIGMLEKNQQGNYFFKQGHFSLAKLEDAPAILKEKVEDDISFAAIRHKTSSKRKVLLWVTLVIVIGVIASAAWYFLHRDEITDQPVNENATETITPVPVVKDTVKPALRDTFLVSEKPAAGYSFKVVFMETIDKEKAMARMNYLIRRKHHVIMYTKDSVYYKLAEPFKLPLSDTTRIKDSLNSYYYSNKAFIELY